MQIYRYDSKMFFFFINKCAQVAFKGGFWVRDNLVCEEGLSVRRNSSNIEEDIQLRFIVCRALLGRALLAFIVDGFYWNCYFLFRKFKVMPILCAHHSIQGNILFSSLGVGVDGLKMRRKKLSNFLKG